MGILKKILPFIFGICFFLGIASDCAFDVAADDDIVLTLSAEQTLALYGQTLSGTWYNQDDGFTRTIQFHYATTTEYWRPLDYDSSNTYIHSLSLSGYSDIPTIKTNLERQTFLIYKCDVSPYEGTSPWVPSSTSNHANVALDFSVNFTGLSVWDQYFMWGISTSNGEVNRNPNYSYILSYLNSDTPYKQTALRRQYGQYYYLGYAQLPFYQPVSKDYITESQFGYCAIIQNRFGLDGNSYDLSQQSLTLQAFKSYKVYDSHLTDSINGVNCLLLFISCPTLSGYNVFPETEAPVTGTNNTVTSIGTTASYQTYPTVDLSGLESGMATMVQQQDEGNYYERIQIDQLNTIIEQLNAIYAAMVQSGEVPLTLTPAAEIPKLGTNIMTDISSAVEGFTVAQLPDDPSLTSGVGSIFTFISLFTNIDSLSVIFVLGSFSIGFGIFAWFIFRGRQS